MSHRSWSVMELGQLVRLWRLGYGVGTIALALKVPAVDVAEKIEELRLKERSRKRLTLKRTKDETPESLQSIWH